jgi:hypothetical protein
MCRMGKARCLGADSVPLHPLHQLFYGRVHKDEEIAVLDFVEQNRIKLVIRKNPGFSAKHASEPFRHKRSDPVVSSEWIAVTNDAGPIWFRFCPVHESIPLQFPQEHSIASEYPDSQRHLPEGMG